MPTRVVVGLFGEAPAGAVTTPGGRDSVTPASPSRTPRLRRVLGLFLIVAPLTVAASALWVWRPTWLKPSVWLETFSRPDPAADSPKTAEAEPTGAAQGRAAAETAAPRTPTATTAARTPAASRSAADREGASPVQPQSLEIVAQVSEPASSPVADEPAAVAAVQTAATSDVAVVIAPASPAIADAPSGRAFRNGRPATPSRLYGESDAGVTPPEPVGSDRRRLGGLAGAIKPGATVTIEFIVNELGAVESAKAKTPPRTLGESLLLATSLHAIKSWRFRPAQKDGQPVSYQKSISFGAY